MRSWAKVVNSRQVLHLIHGLTVGGAEVDLLQKYAVLHTRHGYEFTIVCLLRRGELAPQFEAQGVRVVGPLMRHRYDAPAGFALRRLLQRHPGSILHTHLAAANLIGWLVNQSLPRGQRKRQLAGEHALADRWPHPVLWLDRQMARSARILVPTAATKESYVARGIPATALHVLPNAIDLARFAAVDVRQARQRIRSELEFNTSDTVLGAVCRLESVKNLAALIECVTPLPVKLVIAGEGAERPRLEELIHARGLGERVRLLGNRSDIPELLAALDLFVLPSHSESFGMAVAEALLMGTPVVATRVGGIPDVTGQGAYALLTPPGDMPALQRAIVQALADSEAMQARAAAGRRFVQESFGAEAVAEQLHAIYQTSAGQVTPRRDL